MNQRQAKIEALKLAWRLIDRYIITLDSSDGVWTQDEMRKIDAELDKLAQRLFERAADLEHGGSNEIQV